MASVIPKPPSAQRQSSRPDSASSSSIVTIQRAPSMTSRSGSATRPVITGLRPKTPNEGSANLSSRTISPDPKRPSPEQKRRTSALYTRPDGRRGSDATANLNRWSHSTASSNKSAVNYNRRSSFSKRLSGSFGSFGGFGSPQGSSPNARKRPRSPPRLGPPAPPMNIPPAPTSPPPVLPPIMTLSSLSQVVGAADSPSTVSAATPRTADPFSPSTTIINDPDYFGNHWDTHPASNMIAKRNTSPDARSPRANPSSPLGNELALASARPPESVYSPRSSKFMDRRVAQNPQHRNRSNSAKSNGTTEGESSASDNRKRSSRHHRRRAPSQKVLLAKALAKANHAVVLDGKQNVEGAILAYNDACTLLRQVMIRSSGDDDRRKLEAVRNTYKNRIVELRSSDVSYQSSDSKALPDRPQERDSRGSERLSIVTDDDDEEMDEQTAKAVPLGHDPRYEPGPRNLSAGPPPLIPPRRQSLHSSAIGEWDLRTLNRDQAQEHLRPLRYDASENLLHAPLHLDRPMYEAYMPAPLSPRRPSSPALASKEALPEDESNDEDSTRQDNDEHKSWLNTINESSGSSASSVHSRRSSVGLRRKRIRAPSGATEAEFGAALDAAIELAYDDGFEPDDEGEDDAEIVHDVDYGYGEHDSLSYRRNIERARERVLEVEREREEAITKARENERMRRKNAFALEATINEDYGDDEAEEEERMLEEMTRDYILDDNEYDLQTKSALPRQSDSSGFSGRTWGSTGSNPTSAGTSLSTVAETPAMPSLAEQMKDNPLPPSVQPPPMAALPPPPTSAPPPPAPVAPILALPPTGLPPRSPSLAIRSTSPGVRDRRLSGVKAKQLTIETNVKLPSGSDSDGPDSQPTAIPPRLIAAQAIAEPSKSAVLISEDEETLPNNTTYKAVPNSATLDSSRKGSFPLAPSDLTDVASPALTKVTSADSDMSLPSLPGSPARFPTKATGLRKNFSSSSLKSKSMMGSMPEVQETSPNTSISSMSSIPKTHKHPSPPVPVLPTPVDTNFIPKGQPMGGIYLFDCDILSYSNPGSPNPSASNTPLPLEPCPDSSLLRPFWFLRCIYQTLANPRGGYITNRLFVPRDIWRVKNIKLKNVEEKVSTCDLLTAALLKLAKVDTLNADAVHEEMQFMDTLMDTVQENLKKKLGSDVGLHGVASIFKGTSVGDDSATASDPLGPRSMNGSSKSYLSSWRKLRSKTSVGPGITSTSSSNVSKDGSKEAPTMKSLPMTTMQNPRFPQRDVNQVQCVGPNPSYMGALARLCDAAQVLDQIVRQVEDPGLRHSSPTYVGLELSVRHAADFFAFYVCRFVLADIGIMMDKFIKRGTEWVLS